MDDDGRRLLRAAVRTGIAHWAFGNLYEDVVRMPERVAERPAPSASPLGPGEPARYFLPAGPLTIAAAVTDAAAEARSGGAHRGPMITAAALVAAAGISGYLIRTVNVPLLAGTAATSDRGALAARWHRWNRVRLALLATAAVASSGAARGWAAADRPGPGRAEHRAVPGGR